MGSFRSTSFFHDGGIDFIDLGRFEVEFGLAVFGPNFVADGVHGADIGGSSEFAGGFGVVRDGFVEADHKDWDTELGVDQFEGCRFATPGAGTDHKIGL